MQQYGSRFKIGENLGYNLTIMWLVSQPKTRLSTHFEIVYSRCVSQVLWSIEWEVLNIVQELYKLSAHNCSKDLEVYLSCDGRTLNIV